MSFVKPTLTDFITSWPSYDTPEYLPTLQEVMDESFVLWGDKISLLPQEKQSIAFKFAVCHQFELSCWTQMGYPGIPNELKSRNDSVVFKGNRSGLRGTSCGLKLLTLLKTVRPGMLYAGQTDFGCNSTGCGC